MTAVVTGNSVGLRMPIGTSPPCVILGLVSRTQGATYSEVGAKAGQDDRAHALVGVANDILGRAAVFDDIEQVIQREKTRKRGRTARSSGTRIGSTFIRRCWRRMDLLPARPAEGWVLGPSPRMTSRVAAVVLISRPCAISSALRGGWLSQATEPLGRAVRAPQRAAVRQRLLGIRQCTFFSVSETAPTRQSMATLASP
jgi:hypothetical protein